MAGSMDCYGLSDVGQVRPVNEDQFLIADLNRSMLVHQTSLSIDDHTRLFGGSQGKLLLVADGVGGRSGGQRASTVAVDSLVHCVLNTMPWLFQLEADLDDDLTEQLKSGLLRCQKRIETEAAAMPDRAGMGTTVTMGYIVWPRLFVLHAGDSRCYLRRNERLEQITTDHTIAQQLVEAGTLQQDEADETRWSHVLWNYVGGDSPNLHVELSTAELTLGDTLLFCTDGLTGDVSDEEISKCLGHEIAADTICHQLIDAANQAGGKDNITVVVCRFDSVETQQESVETAAAKRVSADTLADTQPTPAQANQLAAGDKEADTVESPT